MSQDNIEVVEQAAVLFQFRAGKVTRLVLHWDRDRALPDLGLAPETSSRE